jgi:hypothetical protein
LTVALSHACPGEFHEAQSIAATLTYGFGGATQVIAAIEAAARPTRRSSPRSSAIAPEAALIRDEDPATGERRFRAALSGQVEIRYAPSSTMACGRRSHPSARQHDWSELPQDVLPYLLPSRFSPSDEFMRFAQREFRRVEGGGARVLACSTGSTPISTMSMASATR